MRKLTYLCVAFVLAAMLGLPAAAQRSRANNGASKQTSQARAEEVQATNKKGDKDPAPSKGSKRKSQGKKTRTGGGWEKNTKHKGSSK